MQMALRSQKARAVTRGAVRCSAWLGLRLIRAALAHGAGRLVCADQHDARSNSGQDAGNVSFIGAYLEGSSALYSRNRTCFTVIPVSLTSSALSSFSGGRIAIKWDAPSSAAKRRSSESSTNVSSARTNTKLWGELARPSKILGSKFPMVPARNSRNLWSNGLGRVLASSSIILPCDSCSFRNALARSSRLTRRPIKIRIPDTTQPATVKREGICHAPETV